jgi:YVTN family beta-propeller protein
MSYEIPMKTTISLILFSLLTMTFLISTVFSSEIGTANAQKYSVIATIPVGVGPSGVAINPSNGLVYVANVRSNIVSVIDPATNKVVATIPVGEGPSGVAINPSNGLVYVANFRSSTVSVVSTVS